MRGKVRRRKGHAANLPVRATVASRRGRTAPCQSDAFSPEFRRSSWRFEEGWQVFWHQYKTIRGIGRDTATVPRSKANTKRQAFASTLLGRAMQQWWTPKPTALAKTRDIRNLAGRIGTLNGNNGPGFMRTQSRRICPNQALIGGSQPNLRHFSLCPATHWGYSI